MPLFGPNIKKMKEKGDIDALVSLLKSDNLQRRVEAFEALAEIGDRRTNKVLIKEFTDIFRFGSEKDKVQAITIMRGRAGVGLIGVKLLLDLWGIGDFSKVKFTRKFGLALARPILISLATSQEEASAIRWYSAVALVELGDRSNEVMQLVMDTLSMMQKMNIDIVEESLRALSSFGGNSALVGMFIEVQKGQLFKAVLDVGPRTAAIYALAATGEPSAREYLEYLATHGDKFYRKRAQIALKLFGKANYDEIEANAEREIID